ncbi:glycosyltransferase family 4 protein [Sanguibacter suarezii]|uniref:glycosyltransferase family 4 protein n=1 Tax=Sanguibacter suarezii TaxID=60921 RepID=UPI0014707886|nr:glycosyltransferase family 4 protein [Sanguibacter suarezii]
MTGFPAYLVSQGWDVHVVSAPGPKLQALAEQGGVSVHALEMRRDPAPLDDLRSLISWFRLLRKVRPDVMSVGTPKAGLLGSIAGLLTRVPARVYLLRGLRYETTAGLKRSFLLGLEKLSAACSHKVVAVSESLRKTAVADGVSPPHKMVVIGSGSSNGVDMERFAMTTEERTQAQNDRWPNDVRPVVGFIGRIHPDKGLDLLADAAEILATDRVAGRLLVVGESDAAEGEALKERLRSSPWEVELVGSTQDIVPFLRLMDVLCLPTLREGFPNVVLEAAAAGIPTVATAATGVVDAVVDGTTGLICADRDPRLLAGHLAWLLGDPGRRTTLGENALSLTGTEFSQLLVWQGAEGFYARVTAANQAVPRRGQDRLPPKTRS